MISAHDLMLGGTASPLADHGSNYFYLHKTLINIANSLNHDGEEQNAAK